MRSYFTRLVVSFILISLLPVLLTGTSFYLAARRMVVHTALNRATESINISVQHITEIIDTYRHVAYVISKDPLSMDAIKGTSDWNSEMLKKLYKMMYESLQGHIYSAAAHLISGDGAYVFSTHKLPKRYDLGIYENHEGIFSEHRPNPEKSYIYVDPFVTERGDRVAFSILREIDGGYVIVDVYAGPLVARESHQYFDSILIADMELLRAFDYFHPERDGTFDHFEELQIIDFSEESTSSILSGNLLAVSARLPDTQLYAVGGVHIEDYLHSLSSIGILGIWFLFIMIIIILLISFRISRSISGPVHSLADAMKKTENGQLTHVTELKRHDELGYLVHSYNIMVDRIDELIEKTRMEERSLQIAERKALQAQIKPHFLYNTLGTIKSLAKMQKGPEISDMVTRLGKVLRSAFKSEKLFWTLGEELDIIQDYVAIQSYRFGDRLKVTYNIEDHILEAAVPRLLLQPIVENAIVHSVEESADTVLVEISSRGRAGYLYFYINDNGPGMPSQTGEDLLGESGGIGLKNVKRRIFLAYGDRGSFSLKSNKDKGTRVTITIPDERPRGAGTDV